MKKAELLLLILMAATFTASARESLLDSLVNACRKVESVECGFVQTRRVSLMNGDIVSKGSLTYRKPDYLKWKYDTPETLTFEIDGNGVSVVREKDGGTTDVGNNRMYRELAKILLGAVSGDFIADSRLFKTEVTGDGKMVSARLVPVKGELKRMWTSMTMNFDQVSYKALSIDITEAGGNTTHIEFIY